MDKVSDDANAAPSETFSGGEHGAQMSENQEMARIRREFTAELEAERARLKYLFDKAPAFVVLLHGPEHIFETANPAYLQLVGHRELIGKTAREAFPEVEGQGFFELLDAVYTTGKPYVGRALPINFQYEPGEPLEQRFVDFVYQPVFDGEGKVSGIFVHGVDVTDHKVAEESVANLARQIERQARVYETTLSNITDFAYIFDTDGRFIYSNRALLDLLGITLEEIQGKNFFDLQYPTDLATRLQAQIQRVFDTKETLLDETPFTSPTGADGYYEYIFSPVLDTDGKVEVVAGSTRDITGRKQAESRLSLLANLSELTRNCEEPNELLFEVARAVGEHLRARRCLFNEIDLEHDREIVHRDYCHGAQSVAGEHKVSDYSSITSTDMRAGKTIVNDDSKIDPRTVELYEKAYAPNGERAYVAVPLLRDNHWVASLWVSDDAPRCWSEHEISLLETVAERTWSAIERLRVDAALRESEERFRHLADNMSQFAWMADATGAIFWYNRRWFAYTGTTLAEMQGWGWQAVHHPDHVERVTKHFKESVAAGTDWEDTFPLRAKTGEYCWFLSRALPIRDAQGNIVRWFGTNTDITAQKRAEEELARLFESEQAAREGAETANRLKDEFLATVSHELRTPLTAMLGWTHLLRAGQLDAAGAQRALETVERNARAQQQLVEDLLDVSRIITGKLRLDVRPCDPATFIEAAVEAVQPAADAKDVRLQKTLDTSINAISGDPERLQQVVWNLLANAIKFTPGGGRVQVRLERVNSHIEIIISDTGMGISEDFLPYVFDRFRQADGTTTRTHGGLGLGLSIVRHLVELHGGTVQAESDGAGQGSTFTVKLPLIHVSQPRTEEERVHPRASDAPAPVECPERLDGVKVLVVDDEADACELLRMLLTRCGAEVSTADNVEDALAAVSQTRFDLLVSDIGMPIADGYELIRRLRALPGVRGGNIPAVALTAYARSEDRLRALRSGYQMHVAKPVEAAELIAVVASLVRRIQHD